ncbi:MAG: 5-deoxy-glucuronate isomerase [Candidatus Caldatribacteriaceae bacterium]
MLLFRHRDFPKNQLEVIAHPGNSPLRFERFEKLWLEEGKSFSGKLGEEEAVVVLLRGKVRLFVDQDPLGETGTRDSVFRDPAWSFYLAPKITYSIEALQESILLVVKAFSQKGGSSAMIPPEKTTERIVGEGTFERVVRTIVGADFPAEKLLVGETFNRPGLWSSYPPHRHEQNRPPEEYYLEEVYHYQVEPEGGFGIQVFYTEDHAFEEAYLVYHGDTFVIPRGYHPVVAAPGYRLYYFWALAGETRILHPYDDPLHRHVKESRRVRNG